MSLPLAALLYASLIFLSYAGEGAHAGNLAPVDLAFEKIIIVYQADLQARGKRVVLVRSEGDFPSTASIDPYQNPVKILINSKRAAHESSFNEADWLQILCHEIGHLLGGAPYIFINPGDWGEISAEGQADYFAAAKCMKRVWANEMENRKALKGMDSANVASARAQGCRDDQCVRIAVATFEFFRKLDPEQNLSLDRRSPDRATSTHVHPWALPTHCRVDTSLAGAVCPINPSIPFSALNQRDGSCVNDSLNSLERLGARPGCWFAPENVDREW